MTGVGTKVEQRRRELGLGQEELAELAGVSVRFVRDVEHGKETARMDKVEAVLEVLGLVLDVRLRST